MKHFFQDTRGSAILWTLFLILILFALSAVVYTGTTVYAKYQTCETELERAALVTVDAGLLNANVRDLQLDVPADAAQSLLEGNLTDAGWVRENGRWVKYTGDKLTYTLEDAQLSVQEKTLRLDAMFVMPAPWAMSGVTEIRIPMTVLSSVLYIE
ncbi:MAG TPA: hypothetical protein PKD52_08935 [Clostridiales bacterium]|nr:hypothetical protein [Clostridiales bacterium]